MNAEQSIRIAALVFAAAAGVMAFLISENLIFIERLVLAAAPVAQTSLKIYFHVKKGKVSFHDLLSRKDNNAEILAAAAR